MKTMESGATTTAVHRFLFLDACNGADSMVPIRWRWHSRFSRTWRAARLGTGLEYPFRSSLSNIAESHDSARGMFLEGAQNHQSFLRPLLYIRYLTTRDEVPKRRPVETTCSQSSSTASQAVLYLDLLGDTSELRPTDAVRLPPPGSRLRTHQLQLPPSSGISWLSTFLAVGVEPLPIVACCMSFPVLLSSPHVETSARPRFRPRRLRRSGQSRPVPFSSLGCLPSLSGTGSTLHSSWMLSLWICSC